MLRDLDRENAIKEWAIVINGETQKTDLNYMKAIIGQYGADVNAYGDGEELAVKLYF